MKNLYYNLVRDLYCNHVDLLFPQLFYISIIMIKYELFPYTSNLTNIFLSLPFQTIHPFSHAPWNGLVYFGVSCIFDSRAKLAVTGL